MVRRWLAVCIAIASCSGCSGSRLIPVAASALSSSSSSSSSFASVARTGVGVKLTLHVPARQRDGALHPSTVSPLTQSVGIAVNDGTPQLFNVRRHSAGCRASSTGTTCTFSIDAPPGTDVFAVATYSGTGGRGRMLDYGKAAVAVAAGKRNDPHVTLGPAVTSTAASGIGSLRYALSVASAGDTVWFLLPAGSTIALDGPIVFSQDLTVAGPGVTLRDKRYSGVVVDARRTGQAFVVPRGVAAAISGLIVANGVTTSAGGDVANAGTLTLANDAIVYGLASCTQSGTFGGGVYNDGTLFVQDAYFDTDVSPGGCGGFGYGGAIYNDAAGTMYVARTIFQNDAAPAGGAVYNAGTAAFAHDTFAANFGCTAAETACASSGCSGNGCQTFPFGFGAAMYDAAGPGVTIRDSTFTGNVAGGAVSGSIGAGGALYLAAGSPAIVATTFTGNVAGGGSDNCSAGAGGAIFELLAAPGTVTLQNDTFAKNVAGGDAGGAGGAVYDGRAALNAANDSFEANAAFGAGSACQPNASAAAGAVYAGDGGTIASSSFADNTVKANYSAGAGAVFGDALAPLTLRGDAFSSNAVSVTGANAYYAYGGAVATRSALASNGNGFSGNAVTADAASTRAAAAGGALWSFGNVSSSSDDFKANAATGPYLVFGGAVFANASYAVAGDTFAANAATQGNAAPYDAEGGGLYAFTGGNVTNATFTGNVAGSGQYGGYGGGLALAGGSATFTGLTATANSATDEGGGLYVRGDLTIDASTIANNRVSSTDNAAGGGGLSAWSSTVVSNSTISGNTVTLGNTNTIAGGGGIRNDGGLFVVGTTIGSNAVVGTGHPSTDNGGGGVWNDNAAILLNATIVGNQSSVDGGGLAQYQNAPVALQNVTLYQNGAAGNGGNIYNSTVSQSLSLANTIVAGGTASAGSDVDNEGTLASGNYNLIGTGVAGYGTFDAAAGDLVGSPTKAIDPRLMPPANNGGPTLTDADTQGSPGRGTIPFAGGRCNGIANDAADQRGFARGNGGVCDIGAYEYAGIAASVRHARPHAVALHASPRSRRAIRPPAPPEPMTSFSSVLRRLPRMPHPRLSNSLRSPPS